MPRLTPTKEELSPITCEGHPFAEEFEKMQRERVPLTFWVWDDAKGEFVQVDPPFISP